MKFKTPAFWYQPVENTPLIFRPLSPLGYLYPLVGMIRACCSNPFKANIPVICIGNLTAGGSGKTPVALALLELLRTYEIAQNPCFLTRGYGGKEKGPLFVTATSSPNAVGDESLMLSEHAPTIIARNRAEGAKLAQDSKHDLIIMDDGFQNPSLYKDVSLLVVDGPLSFGNRLFLPFGPLREPIDKGLSRASAIIALNGHPDGLSSKPVIKASILPVTNLPAGQKVVAFCGLGKPEKFKKTLDQQDVKILEFHTFPDHHPYSPADLSRLKDQARQHNALLLTTEKDACRIDDLSGISVFKIALKFDDQEELAALLKEKL